MKNILIISAVTLMLIANSCKKNIPVHSIDARLVAAFNFKPGTYWVYKDSLTGQEDSFAVTSIESGPDQINGYIDYSTDIFITGFPISGTNNTDSIQWEYGLNGDSFYFTYKNSNAKSIYGAEIDYGSIFSYPFVIEKVNSTGAVLNNTIANSAKLVINSQSYSNAAIVNSTLNLYPLENWSCNDWFYVVAKIGFIKIVLNEPNDSFYRIWELQRYNIVL